MNQLLDGRYELLRQIGAAHGATYWEAHDQQASRPVMVKILGEPEREERARYERELQVLGSLRSPHILRMFSYGSTPDGRPFLIFEHVHGAPLSELEPGIPVDVVEHIVRQVASALWEAHQQGLVHRGLRPDAIRVFEHAGDRFAVKVADFSLLRGTGRAQQLTATGVVLGTPEYMSPEQLRGEPLSGATDVYSLGVVAASLLRGQGVTAGPHEVASRVGAGDLSVIRPDAVDFANTLRRMLSANPADRPTMASLAERRHRPRPAPLATIAPQAHESQSPRPKRRWVAAAVGAALLAALGVAAVFIADAPDEPAPQPVERRTKPSGLVRTQTPEPVERVATPDLGQPAEPLANGCGIPAPFTGRGMLSQDVGLSRSSWMVYVGKAYDPDNPAPLVVLVHQVFRTAAEFLQYSGFVEIADREGLVLMLPTDDDMIPWKAQEDYARVRAEIESTRKQLCIDEERIYVVGHGQGGSVAIDLSCEPWIAGIATSAHSTGGTATRCDDRPVPAIELHPLHSAHAPFKGGLGCQSGQKVGAAEWEKAWRKRNSCGTSSTVRVREKGTTCREWSCEVPFESCHVNVGQTWPGAPLRTNLLHITKDCDGPTSDFAAAREIWAFFSRARTAAAAPE